MVVVVVVVVGGGGGGGASGGGSGGGSGWIDHAQLFTFIGLYFVSSFIHYFTLHWYLFHVYVYSLFYYPFYCSLFRFFIIVVFSHSYIYLPVHVLIDVFIF